MSDEALRLARAEQANQALIQFLGPAFDVCRADYLEKLADIAAKPLTNDMRAAMEKLALGLKVIDVVRSQILSLVVDGNVAQSEARRASDLANMTTEKRRWAQF